ncbi:hypothetical protein M422DRAFT_25405, partial [Sphaerobolus stellatus SS14]
YSSRSFPCGLPDKADQPSRYTCYIRSPTCIPTIIAILQYPSNTRIQSWHSMKSKGRLDQTKDDHSWGAPWCGQLCCCGFAASGTM